MIDKTASLMTGGHVQGRGQYTYREIMSEGVVWQATLQDFTDQSGAITDLLHKPFEEVIFTGCGSTYYLSLAAAAAWQAITGMPARGVPASELWLFPETLISRQKTLLVAVSRSGETSETLRAIQVFRDQKGPSILGVSVCPDSSLVKQVPYSLVAKESQEESVAQTRSFTSMFILTLAAAYQAAGNTRGLEDLQGLPGKFRPLVENYEPLSRSLGEDRHLNQFFFLGSGWNYGLACEAMLKMKEMSLSSSQAFHVMEFRHGPKSVVAPGTLVVGLLSEAGYNQEIRVLGEMRSLGATVMAIVEGDMDLPADNVIKLHTGLPEPARAILQLPALQLMAFYRAIENGLDPDRPSHLEAVVRLE